MRKKKALRYNAAKRRWSLVHFRSLEPMVQVLEFGADKYAPDNWKNEMDKKQILESLTRHLAALMDGERNDPESGLPHIGHIMANGMFFAFHDEQKKK